MSQTQNVVRQTQHAMSQMLLVNRLVDQLASGSRQMSMASKPLTCS
jgi:hypothetical protein